MKKYAVRVVTLGMLGLGVALAVLTLMQVGQVQAAGNVPALAFLGEGGTYSVGEGYSFIVKTKHPYSFMAMPGPEYTARPSERVWSVLGDFEAPAAEFQNTTVVGPVQMGCVVDFATIDDDEDERINYFLLDGAVIYTMGQGMATRGRFFVPHDGTLSYIANDSIGMFLSVCDKTVTLTPTMTLSPTATLRGTLIATPTMPPTITATPSPTPITPTAEPDIITATPSPTPTKQPRLPACLRINFEVSGQEAKRGLYIVQEIGGHFLAAWEADNGWKDSGWFQGIDITFPAVYVEVLYYHGPGVEPVRLRMLNPAPDADAGWVARGQCHALEVGWP